MSKPLMVGLVLASLLTGCHAPTVLQAAPIEAERTVSGTAVKRLLPAGTPVVGPKSNVGIKPNMTPRSGAPMISTSAPNALTAGDGVSFVRMFADGRVQTSASFPGEVFA